MDAKLSAIDIMGRNRCDGGRASVSHPTPDAFPNLP